MSFSVVSYVRGQSELSQSQPWPNTMCEVSVLAASCDDDFLGSEDSFYVNHEVIRGRARSENKNLMKKDFVKIEGDASFPGGKRFSIYET